MAPSTVLAQAKMPSPKTVKLRRGIEVTKMRDLDYGRVIVTDRTGAFDFFAAGRLLHRNKGAPGVYARRFTIEVLHQ